MRPEFLDAQEIRGPPWRPPKMISEPPPSGGSPTQDIRPTSLSGP